MRPSKLDGAVTRAHGGRSPFGQWFDRLDDIAAARVKTSLNRLGRGTGLRRKASGGVFEVKIDFGPSYRLYFGKDGDQIVILPGRDEESPEPRIEAAKDTWKQY